MGDVAKEGRTVLFVSHNMGAVARLCNKGIVLRKGKLSYSGDITSAIELYTGSETPSSAELYFEPNYTKRMQFTSIKLLNEDGIPAARLDRDAPFQVSFEFEVRENISNAHIAVMLEKADGTPIIHATDLDDNPNQSSLNDSIRETGKYKVTVEFPGHLLNAGIYQIRAGLAQRAGEIFDYVEPFTFHLVDHGSFAAIGVNGNQRPGILSFPLKWTVD